MSDLRGRINSLREEILEEIQKKPEELQAKKILELCIMLDKLVVEYTYLRCLSWTGLFKALIAFLFIY